MARKKVQRNLSVRERSEIVKKDQYIPKGRFFHGLDCQEEFNGILEFMDVCEFIWENDDDNGITLGFSIYVGEAYTKNPVWVWMGSAIWSDWEMDREIVPPVISPKTEEDEIQEFDEKKNPDKEPVHICNDCGYPNPTNVRFCWGCHKDLDNGGYQFYLAPTQ